MRENKWLRLGIWRKRAEWEWRRLSAWKDGERKRRWGAEWGVNTRDVRRGSGRRHKEVGWRWVITRLSSPVGRVAVGVVVWHIQIHRGFSGQHAASMSPPAAEAGGRQYGDTTETRQSKAVQLQTILSFFWHTHTYEHYNGRAGGLCHWAIIAAVLSWRSSWISCIHFLSSFILYKAVHMQRRLV